MCWGGDSTCSRTFTPLHDQPAAGSLCDRLRAIDRSELCAHRPDVLIGAVRRSGFSPEAYGNDKKCNEPAASAAGQGHEKPAPASGGLQQSGMGSEAFGGSCPGAPHFA